MENGEIVFSAQNMFQEMTGASLKVPLRENEMEDPPYIETYIKKFSIFDLFIYNLISKYCRNIFKTRTKVEGEHH